MRVPKSLEVAANRFLAVGIARTRKNSRTQSVILDAMIPDEIDSRDHVLRTCGSLTLLSPKRILPRNYAQAHNGENTKQAHKNFRARGPSQGRRFPPKIMCSPAGTAPVRLARRILSGPLGLLQLRDGTKDLPRREKSPALPAVAIRPESKLPIMGLRRTSVTRAGAAARHNFYRCRFFPESTGALPVSVRSAPGDAPASR